MDEGGVFFRTFDEVEGADIAVSFFLRSAGILDDFDKEGRGLLAAEAPDDIAARRGVPVVTDFREPCVQHFIVLRGGTDAESFKIPAVFAVVLLRESGPKFGSFRRRIAMEGKGTFAEDLTVGIVDEALNDWDRVLVFSTKVAKREDPDGRIFISDRGVEVLLLAAVNAGEEIPGASADFGFVALQEFAKGSFCLLFHLMKGLPREIAGFLIRRFESGDGAIDGRNVWFGDFVFVALWRDAVDAASHGFEFLVTHLVATDAGIIPISHEDGAIGRGGDVGRAEPIVFAGEEIDDAGLVAGAIRFDAVAANDARAGVAMNDVMAEIFEEIPFVKQDSGGRTVAGLEKIRDDARVV